MQRGVLIIFCIFCNNGAAFWTMQFIQTKRSAQNVLARGLRILNGEPVKQQERGINCAPDQAGAVVICYLLVTLKGLQTSFMCIRRYFLM